MARFEAELGALERALAVIADTPVIDWATLRKIRCAPRAKTSDSRRSAE